MSTQRVYQLLPPLLCMFDVVIHHIGIGAFEHALVSDEQMVIFLCPDVTSLVPTTRTLKGKRAKSFDLANLFIQFPLVLSCQNHVKMIRQNIPGNHWNSMRTAGSRDILGN